ncbi:MAG: PadR family transcriptional regulator [Nocardiopsaceae bacterium]|jgi:DNA-binding PadR family transcriptional regulator|nr:PadR family transcriptional regulator [Nocardiopsaceae bacterium]
MAAAQLTPFEHVLLGLVCLSPASGYDLKRTFATTPAGVYQPSSGVLYPALRRLEAKALIQAKPPDSATRSARRRRVYEPTEAGQAAHLAWLRTPVEPATVARDLGLHLMRFVMMESAFPPDDVLGFLTSLKDALTASTAQLERYAAAPAQSLGRHPRLALNHGLAIHRATLRWIRETMAALRSPGEPRREY